jgi:hypothetical protein
MLKFGIGLALYNLQMLERAQRRVYEKEYLKLMALSFMVFIGTVACSNSPSSDSSITGTEVSGSSSPEGKPSATPPPSESGSDATPTLPTPPTPIVDPIESSHSLYAAFLGTDKAVVKKSFEAHCPDFSSEPALIKKANCLFTMAFELDPQLKAWVESAKSHALNANEQLEGTEPLTGWGPTLFQGTIVQLTKVAMAIRTRLFKVAGAYGIKFYETDLSMAYSVAKYKTGRENFLKSLALKTGGEMNAELGDLYDSVVLLYLNKDLSSNAMTFLDFQNKAPLAPGSGGIFAVDGAFIENFYFGGFGVLDDLQIQFQYGK